MLISTIGHSVSIHLCGGEIENMALFGQAQACSVQANGCYADLKGNNGSFHIKGCCEDKTLIIDADKFLSKVIGKITDKNYKITPLLPVSISQIENATDALVYAHFVKYKPPIIGRDITIIVQALLI